VVGLCVRPGPRLFEFPYVEPAPRTGTLVPYGGGMSVFPSDRPADLKPNSQTTDSLRLASKVLERAGD